MQAAEDIFSGTPSMMTLFCFFTQPDFPYIESILAKYPAKEAKVISGFCYEEFCGRRNSTQYPKDQNYASIFDYATETKFASSLESNLIENGILASHFKKSFYPIILEKYEVVKKAILKMIEVEKPDHVFLPEDSDFIRGRLASRIFKENNIRHSILMPNFYQKTASYAQLGVSNADEYLIYVSEMNEVLRQRGIGESKIKKTEHPFKRFHTTDKKNFVTYICQGIEWEEFIIRDLSEICDKLQCKLCVRPHPSFPFHKNTNVNYYWTGSLTDLLKKSEVILTQHSIVGYEAHFNEIPVIIVNYSGEPISIRGADQFHSICHTKDEISRSLLQLINLKP